ncbi:hypothetical protein ACOMHN_026122 [Nucella lapillus]
MSSSALPLSSTLLPPLPKFNGTCVPIQYPCYPGTRYIDPCDCQFYYLCRTTGSIVRLACVRGTAFDHTGATSVCQSISRVVGRAGKCDQSLPWKRCTDRYGTTADLQKLKSWCTSSGYLTPPPPRRRGDDGANAGAIAAIIILLLLLAVVVALIVLYVRKKGNPLEKVKNTSCWQNVVWCWNEVVCCGSDGSGYYYDDDDDDDDDNDIGNNNNNTAERPRQGSVPGSGTGTAGDGSGPHQASSEASALHLSKSAADLPPVSGRRPRQGSVPVADTWTGDGDGARQSAFSLPSSLHLSRSAADLPPLPGRRSSRQEKEKGIEGADGTIHDFGEAKIERRMSARRSQVAIAEDPDLEAAAAAIYDNPAFNPNFAQSDTPPLDTELAPAPPAYSSRARELNRMDPDLIEASIEEDAIPMGQARLAAQSLHSHRSNSMPRFRLGSSDDNVSESSFVA